MSMKPFKEVIKYMTDYPGEKEFSYYLPGLDVNNLKKNKDEQFYNFEFHNQVSHILNTIVKEDPIAGNVIIKRYLNNFIIFPQNNSNTIEIGIGSSNNLFMLEKRRKKDASFSGYGFITETFDQMKSFNELRKEIPNLQYTYAFFKGKDLKTDVKDIIGWSKKSGENNYLFRLRENPGRILWDSLLDLSTDDFLLIIVQILLTASEIGIVIKRNKYSFSIDEVYIKKLPYPINIRYRNLNIVMTTNIIAVMTFNQGWELADGSNFAGLIYDLFEASFKKKMKEEDKTNRVQLNAKRSFISKYPIYPMLNIIEFWTKLGDRMPNARSRVMSDYKSKYPGQFNIFDNLFAYEGQVVFGCESLPCLEEKDLLRIAPSDITFKDILELYLYLKCGGMIRQEEIGYEKRVHFRELTTLFVEELQKNVMIIESLLKSIHLPIFKAIFNPVVSQRENDQVTYRRYFIELKDEHIKFTKAKDLYEFCKDYLNIFIYVSEKLKQEVPETKEKCKNMLLPIPGYLNIVENAFKTTMAGMQQQPLPVNFISDVELSWVKDYIAE